MPPSGTPIFFAAFAEHGQGDRYPLLSWIFHHQKHVIDNFHRLDV